MRVHTPVWSMELAPGWRAEERRGAEDHEDYVAILNDEPDTLLRLSSLELPWGMTAANWIEFVDRGHLPKGRPVTRVQCGDFEGTRTEFLSLDINISPRLGDRWLRAWVLQCDGTPLDVGYQCPMWCAGRWDQEVIAMLDTLRAGPRIRP